MFTLSPPWFHRRMVPGKASRDEKKAITEALIALFGEPYDKGENRRGSRWKTSVIVEVLSIPDLDVFESEEDKKDFQEQVEKNALPF